MSFNGKGIGGRKGDPVRDAKIAALYVKGVDVPALCQRFGLQSSTVHRALALHGVQIRGGKQGRATDGRYKLR